MKKVTALFCAMLAVTRLLAGCTGQSEKITKPADLEGKVVATVSSPQDPALMQALAEQQTGVEFKEMQFYDGISAAIAALKSGKADAVFVVGDLVVDYYTSRDDTLGSISLTPTGDATLHMALRAEDTELLEKVNAVLISMSDDGTLANLKKEFITDLTPDKQLEGKEMPRFDGAPTLIVGLSGDAPPIDYVAADGNPAGYNVELLELLSEKMEINFEISVIPMASKFPALTASKIDLFFLHAVSADLEMTIKTLESNNNITVTEPYYEFSGLGYLILK